MINLINSAESNKYRAVVGGSSWSRGPQAEFATISEARRFAESYGTTADYCTIWDRQGRQVAMHMRDDTGNGQRWYRVRV